MAYTTKDTYLSRSATISSISFELDRMKAATHGTRCAYAKAYKEGVFTQHLQLVNVDGSNL